MSSYGIVRRDGRNGFADPLQLEGKPLQLWLQLSEAAQTITIDKSCALILNRAMSLKESFKVIFQPIRILSTCAVCFACLPIYGAPMESIDRAIAKGDLAVVKQMVRADSDRINQGEHPKLTPLHQAILRKHADIALYLIEAGADVNTPDRSQRTPLHLCVDRDLPKVAEALLDAGAEPDEWDKAGWTPLHNAAAQDRLAVAQVLITGGANPHALTERGGTPLHEAAASGGEAMVGLILNLSVDPTVVASDGGTALEVAQAMENMVAIQLISEVLEQTWIDLFDGHSLAGWTSRGGEASYEVRDGVIVGISKLDTHNTFLCADTLYGDFELQFEVKCGAINSGVQIRSKADSDKWLNGPQVEIEQGPGQAGYIYGERMGGWISPEPESTDPKVKKHDLFNNDLWNHYRIVAKGSRIQTWINGVPVADVTDEAVFETHPKGLIGLQVHSHDKADVEIAWRNLRLREL